MRIDQLSNQNNDSISVFGRLDWWLILLYLLLVFIGLTNIYSSEYTEAQSAIFDFKTSHGKQIINVTISLIIGFVILLLDIRFYQSLGYLFYVASLLLLMVTLFIGKTVNGAQGWLVIGSFQLQSAEFTKIGTVFALSKYLSGYGINMQNKRDLIIGVAFIAIPIILVLAQNDTGSALVFLSLFLVLFRNGLNPYVILIPVYLGITGLMVLIFDKTPVLIAIGIITTIVYIFVRKYFRAIIILVAILGLTIGVVFGIDFAFNKILKDYQRERIEVLIGKKVDNKGAGYNVHQSLIAIGSGGFLGKGFLKGTQTKFNFVPEQTTDFIFCTIGEEWGFVGSFILILLYVLLMSRLILIADNQKNEFSKYFCYGAASIFFFHFLINLAMVMGLFPVIGIPLPFVSYGGSSMLSFTILLFVVLKLDESNKSI